MTTKDAKFRYQFKKMVEELEAFRGRGTELISVYIPPDFDMAKVLQQLREEYGTAANIKSKSTRKNVQAAIERIIQFLQSYMRTNKKPPETGLAIFAGNVAEREDYTDIQLYWIEPPEPITTRLYRCDQQFVVEPLKEMLEVKETLGVLVMDGNEATIATVRGKHVEIVRRLTSGIPGKHSKGGQSARRFERLREIATHEYHKRVAEAAAEVFLQIPDLKRILIGGPGPHKEDFLKEELLHPELKKKIAAVIDTGYTDEQGVKEVVNKAEEVLGELEIVQEKKIFQKFMEEVAKESGLAVYGKEKVREALEHGLVDTLLISEAFGEVTATIRCLNCNNQFQKTVKNIETLKRQLLSQECSVCGEKQLQIVETKDAVREFLDLAERFNANVHFISTETEEGEQFYRGFGGIAAILRYKTA
ncbi:MAG: peptide chain release factor aRF-1 [Candidatus Hadarchaeales archaeon]